MRVFIAGGTGKIGARLVPELLRRGDSAVVLSRTAAKVRERFGEQVEAVEGNPTEPGPWMDQVATCDGVINLVGEDIFARRWSDEFKQVIRESRLKSTANVVAAICRARGAPQCGGGRNPDGDPVPAVAGGTPVPPAAAGGGPNVLVQGTAVGYYGPRDDPVLTEDSQPAPAGTDFLADLCVKWERTAQEVEESGCRLATVRTGVVLDREGGALKTMWTPFKLFVGGKVGSGRQWVSWIHWADEVGIVLFCLDTAAVRGAVNAVAPEPVTNKQLAKAFGRALGRPAVFPTPRFMLRLMLGEVANIITTGQRAIPQKATELGYRFQYPTIDAALAQIVRG